MPSAVLVEDHSLVREALKLLLTVQLGVEVTGETGDGNQALDLARRLRPDLVFLDLELPGSHGLDVVARIKAELPDIKVVILTGALSPRSVNAALAAGADAYVLKREESSELMRAIPHVLAGGSYVSKGLADMVAQADRPPVKAILTPREAEILALIARGLSNQEIADTLALSVLTVRKHRQNLMEKLELRNSAEIAAYAIRNGYDKPGESP